MQLFCIENQEYRKDLLVRNSLEFVELVILKLVLMLLEIFCDDYYRKFECQLT